MEAQFMPGYGGLIDLVLRGGKVKRMEAHVVHEKDEFDIIYGTESKLIHKPYLDGDGGKVRGCYAVAWFDNGGTQFEWMTKDEIDAIRKRSKAATSGPWVTDYNEMCRKTTLRRIFKYIPSSPDDKVTQLLDKAIELDNKAVGFPEINVKESTSRTADLAEMMMNNMNGGQGDIADYEDVSQDEESESGKESDIHKEPEKSKKSKDDNKLL
jgi:recombination protein RecT